jgi:hypothetical protein
MLNRPDALTFPALQAYLDRIGAEQVNFRRYVVREWFELENGKRYYRQKAVIRINKTDGSITVKGPFGEDVKEYEPTREEAEAIQALIPQLIAAFPSQHHSTPQHADAQRLALGVARENWFVCPDVNDRNKILFCQQRKDLASGDKDYYPWTFWSDGEWRPMEPDGDLPFWKPPKLRHMPNLMIHEGPKCAAFVDRLLNEDGDARHPWVEELKRYEHWGHMGGAMGIERSDFSELDKIKPKAVVYVCDRDDPGEEALQHFSRKYRKALIGIRFDGRFPYGFDMADPIPEKFFNEYGHYKGPTLSDMMVPATWATRLLPVEGKGRPPAVLRDEFKREWWHSVTPEVYIHRLWPDRIYKEKEFNSRVRPYANVEEVARLLRMDDAGKVEGIDYLPDLPPGIVVERKRVINTHVGSKLRPKVGNAWPWFRFMTRLIPNKKDRKELMRWCATLIACPGTKMTYAVLLVSEKQGVGKSTLAEILALAIGKDNTSYPSETEVTENQFNEYAAHKRLIVVQEIYAGQSSKCYNKIKSLITDDVVTVYLKYLHPYRITNHVHLFACSNSMRALKLPGDDRRWLVPKVAEETRDLAHWIEFYAWLNHGGIEIIMDWAKKFVDKHGQVRKGAHAPDSAAKKEMVVEAYSVGEKLVHDWLTILKEEMLEARKKLTKDPSLKETITEWEAKEIVTTDKALVNVIKHELYEGRHSDKLERELTVRKVAKAAGWFVGKRLTMPDRSQAHLISTDARYVTEKVWIKSTIYKPVSPAVSPYPVARVMIGKDPETDTGINVFISIRNSLPF